MAQTKVKLISDGVIVQSNLHASHGITTAHIGEGSNLYYTNARSRAAISVSGNALSYNSSTGVITSNFEESPTFTGNILLDGTNQLHFVAQSGESNTEPFRITRSSDKMYFTYGENAGDEAFYIESDGEVIFEENVGIGTTSPTAKLKVIGENDAWTCQIENTQALPYGLSVNTTGTAGTTFNSAFYTHSGTGMYIVNNGKVGIGTTSPSANLHVSSTSTAVLKVGTTGVADASVDIRGYDAGVHIGDDTNGLRWAIWNDGPSTSSSLKFGSYALGTWYNDSSQVVTMTSDGKVGIATTAPEERLHVIGSTLISNNEFYKVEKTDGTNYKIAGLTNGNVIQIGAIDYTSAGTIFAGGDNISITTGGASGTTRIKISPSGDVGIGTTSPSSKLTVYGGSSTTSTLELRGGAAGNDNATISTQQSMTFQIGSAGASGRSFVFNKGGLGYGNGTNLASINDAGTFTATGDVVAYSDKKLKKNIKTLDGSKVYKMRGVSFDRIDTGKKSSGVIAQEIQEIAPELVNESDGTLGVAYGNLTGYLIEAIKELEVRVKELENKNCDCKE